MKSATYVNVNSINQEVHDSSQVDKIEKFEALTFKKQATVADLQKRPHTAHKRKSTELDSDTFSRSEKNGKIKLHRNESMKGS